jgi:acetoacetyl-CoA reductase
MSRLALVTGGTKGLGAGSADALAADGFRVAVTCHSADKAVSLRESCRHAVFGWDVSDFAACAAGVAAVEKALGPIDVLVNDAGVTADAMLHKMTREQWDAVVRTDVDSLFNMCRPVIGGMRERGWGRIINISSVNGQKGQIGQTNYAAAKAAVLGFTKALALESAAKGITVNAIAPGYCDTEMVAAVPAEVMTRVLAGVPLGRLGRPEEIGRCVAFLASEEASFITGATLSINGGLFMA